MFISNLKGYETLVRPTMW